jgi:hypothetical protein
MERGMARRIAIAIAKRDLKYTNLSLIEGWTAAGDHPDHLTSPRPHRPSLLPQEAEHDNLI